jgi:hypothetical protein
MKKNYLIAFTLVGLISCQPKVLGVNGLSPVSYVASTVNDFVFTKAFFNQYSTLLNYDLKLFYPIGLSSLERTEFRNNAVSYQASSGASAIYLTTWDTLTGDYAETTLDNTWKGYFNNVLFARNFVGATGKAEQFPQIRVDKPSIVSTSNDSDLTLTIRSAVRYRIAPAEMLLAWSFTEGNGDDIFAYGISFYSDNQLLNTIDFPQQSASVSINTYKAIFPITMTNVNALTFVFSMIDPTGNSNPRFTLHEFNLFAQSEIAVPDNADDNEIFGINYIQVEWWDILGHFNNALWWLVNESFLAPIFEWLNDYIIIYVNFIFNSIGALLGL